MNLPKSICAIALGVGLCFPAALWAQGNGADDPPEILTSDLARKQAVDSDRRTVNFVIVDSDTVSEVYINGERQNITPGDTVVLTKELRFKQGRQLVEVVAVDERGNRRERSYLVLYGVEDEGEAPMLQLRGLVEFRFEFDDNPTNDISSPIPIAGLELDGAVPDDEQTDTRTTLKGTVVASYGALVGFAGVQQIDYAKTENETLDAQILFVGGGYTVKLSPNTSLPLLATFTDVNIGTNDYATVLSLSPGYAITGTDPESGESERTLFGLDLISKEFAQSERDAVTQYTLKWNYRATDPERQDTYNRRIGVGTASEGREETEYTFAGIDWDWNLNWDTGLKFDVGLGYQYRSYPNDDPLTDEFLGSTRIDNLIRFSGGPGWQFTKDWSAMFNFRYLTDLSNKSPYVRVVYGVAVNGAF